jgi:nucleoside-diphosphate-sugar epimerase
MRSVIGDAGFVGSLLIARLLEQGHKVHCVDNRPSVQNIEHLHDHRLAGDRSTFTALCWPAILGPVAKRDGIFS